ncbi:MAG: GGDEF domain-containing protein [Paenibacillaceae bacterium]|nr:GGDEF domain-containing protein [Paenibacillaceae bacterium]
MIESIRMRVAQLLERVEDADVRAQLRDAFEHIEQLALSDALTGCANRLYLDRWWSNAHHGMHMLLIDIDNFKELNDRYGHIVGDGVLRAVAQTWMNNHPHCVFVRYGGDEFVCIDPTMTWDIAESLRSDAARIPIVAGAISALSVSIGALRVPARQCGCGAPALQHVLHVLDHALQQAKRTGRNRYVWADTVYDT